MRLTIRTFFFVMITISVHAQENMLVYRDLPESSKNFSGGSVASRMIDGLGFRFYWATERLKKQDLEYKPGTEARSTLETIEHIYEMSILIKNSTISKPNVRTSKEVLAFPELRKRTLENLKYASDKLRNMTDDDMRKLQVIFKGENASLEFPFWNMINGPIADCIWHTGQIVSFRRASGNPFDENVNLFTGKPPGE